VVKGGDAAQVVNVVVGCIAIRMMDVVSRWDRAEMVLPNLSMKRLDTVADMPRMRSIVEPIAVVG
jgi:hypothetical protein